jgi:hypothetical protein
MTTEEQIDSLILDYRDYQLKRTRAVRRFNTEYVATLDARLRNTREKLDLVMAAQQAEKYFVEHKGPLSIQTTDEPTVADWRRVAARYAETGSEEDYDLMLNLVRLDHPVPNLSAESEPVKTTRKSLGDITLEQIWYGSRWYVLIFTLWIIAIVVGLNLFT